MSGSHGTFPFATVKYLLTVTEQKRKLRRLMNTQPNNLFAGNALLERADHALSPEVYASTIFHLGPLHGQNGDGLVRPDAGDWMT